MNWKCTLDIKKKKKKVMANKFYIPAGRWLGLPFLIVWQRNMPITMPFCCLFILFAKQKLADGCPVEENC